MGKKVAGERIKWDSLSEELQEGFEDCSFEDEDDFILVEEGGWGCLANMNTALTSSSASQMVNILLKT